MSTFAGFNADSYQPSERPAAGPIKAGTYDVEVEDARFPEPYGAGQCFKFMCRIKGGEYDGRVFFFRAAWDHPSDDVVRIGREQLADMSRALNRTRWNAPTELIGRRGKAKLGWEPPKNGYDGSIRVKFWQSQQTPPAPAAKPPAPAQGEAFDYGSDDSDSLPF